LSEEQAAIRVDENNESIESEMLRLRMDIERAKQQKNIEKQLDLKCNLKS
jgi:hypothetical protein